jgi:hypothetical protein
VLAAPELPCWDLLWVAVVVVGTGTKDPTVLDRAVLAAQVVVATETVIMHSLIQVVAAVAGYTGVKLLVVVAPMAL